MSAVMVGDILTKNLPSMLYWPAFCLVDCIFQQNLRTDKCCGFRYRVFGEGGWDTGNRWSPEVCLFIVFDCLGRR